MPKKLIKNYTTEVSAFKSLMEIEQMLAENGAVGIAKDYEAGIVKAMYFRIPYKDTFLPFRLPAKPEKVYAALFAGRQFEERYRVQNTEKSHNIAWRICKDWVEAQITQVNLDQAKMEEVFLPYFVMDDNKTLYESMESGHFLLPAGRTP